MNKIVIPEKTTGRIGMVAVLKRVRECDLGKLVVLREPAGFLTSLIGSAKPVFAWLAHHWVSRLIALARQVMRFTLPMPAFHPLQKCLRLNSRELFPAKIKRTSIRH